MIPSGSGVDSPRVRLDKTIPQIGHFGIDPSPSRLARITLGSIGQKYSEALSKLPTAPLGGRVNLSQ